MTAAHDQKLTVHILCHIPEHEPRESDPHYAAFRNARTRMAAAGLLVCAVPSCKYPGPIELHHQLIEFSMQGGVDVAKFDEVYGLHLDAVSFADFVNSPGNLEPLCAVHHRTHLGIHAIPGPLWDAIRVWKDDLPPAAEVKP